MNGEQRVWTASLISVAILALYAHMLEGKVRANPAATQIAGQAPAALSANNPQAMNSDLALQHIVHEDVVIIESEKLRLKLGKQSAAVRVVQLKDVRDLSSHAELSFGSDARYLLAPMIGKAEVPWSFVSQTQTSATWNKKSSDGAQRYELSIFLNEKQPTYVIQISASNTTPSKQEAPLTIVASWARGDKLTGRYNMLEAVLFSSKNGANNRRHLIYRGSQRQIRDVPRRTWLLTLSERYFCQAIRPSKEAEVSTTLVPSSADAIAAELKGVMVVPASGETQQKFLVFVGPRDFFKLKEAGFEQAFPIGLLGQIGLGIVLLLRGIASLVHNYGVAILILSVIVTTTLSPFTLISLRSMKKIQQLQPKMDQLKKKYEGDQTRLNQEMFALFKQHKVSPASGCVPMLLQMPIFFAFWSAISHSVEFRGASFLWITDLSLPDRLLKFPTGFELNILPLIMAGAMFFQTKMSQASSSAPGSSALSGPMIPIMFGVMFYQVPSCLVLYWLTNSLMSLAIYRIVKT